ncbi:NAD(P)-binding protein [Polyporus arcularius HHB13444]|uniref:NAD(P)-binding protein n=1 Tax=Polyporus arcularius HHB13444 TaxID=1314778 RepID=A0A5C3P0V0_9APHY|nr:NAD(P)-binding protein [Polyporus arcularius HHB13444]
MPPKRSASDANGSGKKSTASKSNAKAAAKKSSRRILVTAGEGQTGRLIIDLLATDDDYTSKYDELTALVFSEEAMSILEEYESVKVILYDPKDDEMLVKSMELVDTCLLIPPARKDKAKITRQLLEAAKKAKTVQNLVLLSSAGADYAERDKQPRLREFIDLEVLAMQPKGDPSTGDTGHSPCIIRAGFYAENLLLYTKQAQGEGKLPIPIGENHKFAPVALGDVAQIAAHAITSEGPHGLADDVRGQILVVTGPQLVAGAELAEAASQALGAKMQFEPITEAAAKKILNSSQGAEVDEAEREYLLEYYSLVREGKTNYTATAAMLAYFGERGQEMSEFFKTYSEEFKPKKRRMTRTKASGGAATRSRG